MKDNNPKNNRLCVLVTGMHRSGTSATTRVLSLLGCDLPKELYVSPGDNETGHWESDNVWRFNNEIIESAGSDWMDWTECSQTWFDSVKAESYYDVAANLIEKEFENSKLFVVKDPRISRVLPFWLSFFERESIKPLIVLTIRNPIEVSASLEKRDNTEQQLNFLMWLRHVLDAEFYSRNQLRVFSLYDDLLKNWLAFAENCQDTFGIKWPNSSEKTYSEIDSFLSRKFHHHQYSNDSVLNNKRIPELVRKTYKVLLSWVETGENKQDFEILDAIRSDLYKFEILFSGFVNKSRKYDNLVGKFNETNASLEHLRNEVQNKVEESNFAKEQVARLELVIASKEQELVNSKQHLIDAENRINNIGVENEAHVAELKTSLSAKEAEIEAQRQQLLDAENRINNIGVENEAHVAELKASLSAKEAEIEAQRQQLLDAENTKNNSIIETESKIAILQTTVSDKEIEIEKYKVKLVDAEHKITKIASESELKIANFVSKFEDYDAKLYYAENVNKQRGAEILDYTKEIEKLREKYNQTIEELKNTNLSLRESKDMVANLKGECSTLSEKNDKLQLSLDNINKQIEYLELSKNKAISTLLRVQSDLVVVQEKANDYIRISDILIEQIIDEKKPIIETKKSSRRRKAEILRKANIVDEAWYIANYSDVAASGINPTLHYITHGKKEGRKPKP